MKKTIITGVLAAALIVSGGTGLYMASAKEIPANPATFMQEQGVNDEQMANMMETGNMDDMQEFMGEQGINYDNMQKIMEEQGVDYEEMQTFMEDGNMNFGQMKGHMSEVHPDLDNQELEEMYKGMHGTGGSVNSQNFQ